MIEGTAIWNAALGYVDVPFKHKGRSRAGLDCIGLIIVAARDAGLALPDFWNYGTFPDSQGLLYAIQGDASRVQPDATQAGDLLLFKFEGSFMHDKPSHFSIFDGEGRIIHALGDPGNIARQPRRHRDKVIVHQFNRAWHARLHSCWRLLGVA